MENTTTDTIRHEESSYKEEATTVYVDAAVLPPLPARAVVGEERKENSDDIAAAVVPPLPPRVLKESEDKAISLPPRVLKESEDDTTPELPPSVIKENEATSLPPRVIKENETTPELPLTEVTCSRHHHKATKKQKTSFCCVVDLSYSALPGVLASVSSAQGLLGSTSSTSDLNCALLSQEDLGLVHKANFAGHKKPIRALCFSRDGSKLATAGSDGLVMLWSVLTYQLIRSFQRPKSQFNTVACSKDNRYLVAGSEEKEILFWSLQSGTLLHTLPEAHRGAVRSVDFSPDSQILASAGADRTVFLWNTADTAICCKLVELDGHTNALRVVQFAPNNEFIVTGSENNSVRVYLSNAQNRQQGDSVVHSNSTYGFKKDAEWVIEFSKNRIVWDIDFTENSAFFAVALGTKSNIRTTTQFLSLGLIAIVSTSTRAITTTITTHGSSCRTVSWCRTEPMLASGGADGSVRVFIWPNKDLENDLMKKKDNLAEFYKVTGRPLPSEYRSILFPPHPLTCDQVRILWQFDDGIALVQSDDGLKGLAPMDSLQAPRNFFTLLEQGETQNWTSYKLLTEMQTVIVDVQELKLFYTACNAAYKLGHLTLEMRNDLLTRALHAAPESIRFDQKSQVLARLKLILNKARNDQVFGEAEALQIDANLEKANVYADYRFQTLAERVQTLEKRVTLVESYAKEIDKRLLTFRQMYHKKIERMHQVTMIKIIFGIVTLGVASVLVDATASVMNSLDNVVDFSDVKDVARVASGDDDAKSWSDVAFKAMEIGAEDWAEQPLETYVQNNKLSTNAASFIGMMRLANSLEPSRKNSHQEYIRQNSSLHSTTSSLQVSTDEMPQPDDLQNLISITGVTNTDDLKIDTRFEMAFEQYYDVDFEDFCDDNKIVLQKLAHFIDKDSSNTIDQLEWNTFCRKVKKRGSLSAFLTWLFTPNRESEI
eukprot:CAMPEP_0197319772 /NCGR_PEP_ID=MMETSP0891-20130614/56292_1 /TAXON_ID=44058 ORGANISM="Aureoumbra lagunensis, Strain CCMP1510" /NCGR_SAMPLE_ID=MMETSP0891 /ASSEMBLY_ACC=CAM_ASM_000534 /LENGTH=941 /DNA_ID=CAMNT_0042810881 /DNA_START=77 /DNA_END=2902 /DNA_ORIENTATION=+